MHTLLGLSSYTQYQKRVKKGKGVDICKKSREQWNQDKGGISARRPWFSLAREKFARRDVKGVVREENTRTRTHKVGTDFV